MAAHKLASPTDTPAEDYFLLQSGEPAMSPAQYFSQYDLRRGHAAHRAPEDVISTVFLPQSNARVLFEFESGQLESATLLERTDERCLRIRTGWVGSAPIVHETFEDMFELVWHDGSWWAKFFETNSTLAEGRA